MGDFLTRAMVWLAMAGYCFAATGLLTGRNSCARWGWTLGCGFFLVHVALAFQVFYSWSHGVALDETARQTEELTGSATAGGLYLNYVFTLVWVADCVWWWVRGDARYAARRRVVTFSLHAFFVFMIFNGAVVFGSGPVRYLGVAVLVIPLAMLLYRRTSSRT